MSKSTVAAAMQEVIVAVKERDALRAELAEAKRLLGWAMTGRDFTPYHVKARANICLYCGRGATSRETLCHTPDCPAGQAKKMVEEK